MILFRVYVQFPWKVGVNKNPWLLYGMVQLEHSAIFSCKWVNCRAEGRAAASFPDPYAIGAWRAQLQLGACRISTTAWTREADKERQWLRGSCTQEVSNYIMSIFNILFQPSSCSFQQHRSCPVCWEGYPKSGISWHQRPDFHRFVCWMRISCQRRGRVWVTDYSRQPNSIQAVACSYIYPQMTQVSSEAHLKCWIGAGNHCNVCLVASIDQVKFTT